MSNRIIVYLTVVDATVSNRVLQETVIEPIEGGLDQCIKNALRRANIDRIDWEYSVDYPSGKNKVHIRAGKHELAAVSLTAVEEGVFC